MSILQVTNFLYLFVLGLSTFFNRSTTLISLARFDDLTKRFEMVRGMMYMCLFVREKEREWGGGRERGMI